MLSRVVQGTAYLLRHLFDAVTVENVTVQITRDDGTVLVPTTQNVEQLSTTEYGFQLTIDHTALLDRLQATWTATLDGQTNSFSDAAEIVGDVLFSNMDLRTAIGDSALDAARIAEARTYAESELERAIGFALVPRYERRRFSGTGSTALFLPLYTRAIRWIEVSGTGVAPMSVTSVQYDGGDILTSPAGWPQGIDNILIGIEHGLDTGNSLLPGARRAALAVAVDYLGGGTVDPRAERLITDDGTLVFGSTSAGEFRVAGVNEWVAANRMPVIA